MNNHYRIFIALACACITLGFHSSVHAFVLLGPVHADENTLTFRDNGGNLITTPVASANIKDDLGGPKQLDEFYRWNTPHLVYGFDRTFVQFFGQEGINAVDDAMRAINDYFIPEDGSYRGVSSLNMAKHGFGGNYNTAWLNATAANENLIDIKSLTLGMMVNYLGLGNPYRYAFTATNSLVPNAAVSGAIFSVVLKNFDPITLAKSDMINGVQYSYRLIHDRVPGSTANIATVNAMTLDMEEFTSDSSGNAYSSVSAIVDAFYGNTDLIWTDVPSLFNFGVYYDGMNAMGGMYQPRHALTHDDAGGLKYLYSTNTISMEYNPYTLISPADYTIPVSQFGLPPSNSEIVNRAAGIFPTRNTAGLPTIFSSTHPLFNYNRANSIGNVMGNNGTGFWGGKAGKMDWAFRGGIDEIQFHSVSYDSLLNMTHYATNFIWTDTFMTNAQIQAQVPSTALNTTPGASIALTAGRSHYFQQILGRDVPAPDFVFSAVGLGDVNGTPVAFTRTTWVDQSSPTVNTPAAGATRMSAPDPINILREIPVGLSGPGTLASGPAANVPSFDIVFNNAYAIGGFEVVWNGEISIVGDMAVPTISQQWAYIKGPGPSDIVRFPDGSFYNTLFQNTILPVEGVPIVALVSDDSGQTAIAPNSYTRTTEELTILGKNFRDATALEIVDNSDVIIQLIYPLTNYIINDSMIVIPNGLIGYDAEGLARRIRVWNTLGRSDPSEEQFSIITGPPVLTSTTYDGLPFNRAEPLTITGMGFKSRQIHLGSTTVNYKDGNATLTNFIIETAGGDNLDGNASGLGRDLQGSLSILSDTRAILAGDAMGAWADGAGRTLRVNRGTTQTVSAPSPTVFQLISALPTVSTLNWVNLADNNQTDINATSALRRDEAIWITGEGLNSTIAIELVRQNGGSYEPPITAYFAAGDMDDNGTKLRLGKYAFNTSEADGFGTVRSKLKLTNLFGDTLYTTPFNVNIQPNDGTAEANEVVIVDGMRTGIPYGIQANLWDRTTTTGDDLTFIGAGLKAVQSIVMLNINGAPKTTPVGGVYELVLDPLGTPGVTVSDTLIRIDTSVVQFTDVNGSDSNNATDYRRFRLSSELGNLHYGDQNKTSRNAIMTTAADGQRFLVGRPPTISDMMIVDAVGADAGHMNWNRDANASVTEHNATIRGYGLALMNKIEMLDGEGSIVTTTSDILLPPPGFNQIPGVLVGDWNSIHSANPNVTLYRSFRSANDWTDQLELNSTIWNTDGSLLDSSVAFSRRIRITTPFGSVVSDDNSSGSFTFSAAPDLAGADSNSTVTGTLASTYGGGGFDGINTYDFNTTNPTGPNYLNLSNPGTWQDLIINGQNFLSIKRIGFNDNTSNYAGGTTGFEVDVDPRDPPAGITFAADGTRINITGSYLYQNAYAWLGSGATITDRHIMLHTANHDGNTTAWQTPVLTIDPTNND